MSNSEQAYDLVVRGGALVIPGVALVGPDVGINGSRLEVIGEGSPRASEVLDTNGKMVPSFVVDPHTLLLMSLFERDRHSFPSCRDTFVPIATTTQLCLAKRN
jgi:N-acyl-D-aspartate/D-glutamate deacylase